MTIVKRGAVVVEALNILMALGSLPAADEPAWLRIGAGVAVVLGITVVAGLVRATAWGAPAGVGAGLLSAAGGIAMIATDENGGEVGLATGALVTVLCALSLRYSGGPWERGRRTTVRRAPGRLTVPGTTTTGTGNDDE